MFTVLLTIVSYISPSILVRSMEMCKVPRSKTMELCVNDIKPTFARILLHVKFVNILK